MFNFKNYPESMHMKGIGIQVKNTVNNRNNFLPQTSDKAPINGALRNDRIP